MKYAPTITIAGIPLQCEFTPNNNAVVLDDVVINWGRDSLYAPTNPSDITITLLDPTGEYSSAAGLYGSELILSTSLGMLFKGRVDGITITPVEIGDDREHVGASAMWEVQITASDVIAAIAKLVISGPGPKATQIAADYIQVYGQGMYPENNTNLRRGNVEVAIRNRGGIAIDVETRDLGQAVPAGKDWQVWYREPDMAMGDDMYTWVQRVQARGDEFFTTNYLPSQNRLTINRWAAPASLELYYQDSIIDVRAIGGTANIVDSCLIGLDDAGTVSASPDHNVTVLEIGEYMRSARNVTRGDGTTGAVLVWENAPQSFPVGSGGGSARYVSPAQLALLTVTPGDPNSSTSEKASDFAARLAPIAAAVNGKLVPPDLVFDIERDDFGADVDSQLMATWTTPDGQPKAWFFPGARYEELRGWGPFFQLIGGQLRFQQGWTHTARFAPSRGAAGNLAINQLVTVDPPQFDQYAASISLGTLGIVTKGL